MPYAKTLDPSLRIWVGRTLAPLLLLISHVKSEPDHSVYSLARGIISELIDVYYIPLESGQGLVIYTIFL